MKVGLIIRKKGACGPFDNGHVSVFWRKKSNLLVRAFIYRLQALPKDCIDDNEERRKFLFENVVEGEVISDAKAAMLMKKEPDKVVVKKWEIPDINFNTLRQRHKHRGCFGKFSFDPVKHECDNCLTWAIKTINLYLPEPLTVPRDGRMKELLSEEELYYVEPN